MTNILSFHTVFYICFQLRQLQLPIVLVLSCGSAHR